MNMRGVSVLVSASLFLAVAAPAQIGFNQEEKMMIQKFKASNPMLEEGKGLFAKGKFDKAEKKFRECLDVFPKNADAHYYLAQIQLKKNDPAKALESIETAKACFSELGKLYSYTHQDMMNRLRDQKAEFEESIRQREATLAEMRGMKGEEAALKISNLETDIQQNKNQIAQIDAQLRRPIPMAMETPSGYDFIHGNILFKMKDYQGAVKQYTETIRRDPRHEFAYNNAANIYFMAGKYDVALKFLKQAEANGVKINEKFKKDLEARLENK
ncbi:MAG TPA: tetratricopeptide repeat protein [Candidatus Aminicenantes bacterium]|nr:tetratricopeptide repeat protein [Candidatus Aminicenantes bacterium]